MFVHKVEETSSEGRRESRSWLTFPIGKPDGAEESHRRMCSSASGRFLMRCSPSLSLFGLFLNLHTSRALLFLLPLSSSLSLFPSRPFLPFQVLVPTFVLRCCCFCLLWPLWSLLWKAADSPLCYLADLDGISQFYSPTSETEPNEGRR